MPTLASQLAAARPGDHICLVYETVDEQVAVTVPFVRQGLERDERVVYVADDRSAADVAASLRENGVDPDAEAARGALRLLTKRESYLRSGEFCPEAMLEVLRALEREAMADGFAGLRIAAEQTGALGLEVGCDRLMEYESLANDFFPGSRSLAVCQYNRRRLGAATIEQVIRTHPVLVVGGRVTQNLYFEPPDVFRSGNGAGASARVSWMLGQLGRAHESAAALRASEARFRAVQEASPDGFALFRAVRDDRGTVIDFEWTYANAAAERTQGAAAAVLAGQRMLARYPGVRAMGLLEAYARVIETGAPYTAEQRYTDEWLDMWFRITAVRAGPDELGVTFVDITERKRAEEALHEARAASEAASRAKSDFLAVMSHELRTPLNAIGGYAELIEMGIHGPVTEPQREALCRIHRSQKHLLGLINEVLNYARVESGAVRYDIEPLAVREAFAAAEALVTPQARAKRICFEADDCDSSVVVRADREKLQQILLNLLSNAVKFTEPGGWVRLECDERGDTVLVRVRDSGVGIAPERLESIFEPFVQGDTRLTRTRDGVGLGLAISRDLARGMGGDLTAESAVGRGSAFTLALPRG